MTEAAQTSRLLAAVPNLLSVFRLALAAVFPLSPAGWRLAIVITGGLSDWLDGFIARRFGAKSASGVLLDAAADKLFVFSVLLTLTYSGLLFWWQMLLVIARDLAVTFVAVYVAVRRDWAAFRRLVPRLAGKLTTGFQFALFAALLIWPDTPLAAAVFAVTALASLAAAGDYLGQFATALREDRRLRGRGA